LSCTLYIADGNPFWPKYSAVLAPTVDLPTARHGQPQLLHSAYFNSLGSYLLISMLHGRTRNKRGRLLV
jgi:hypothetical protein